MIPRSVLVTVLVTLWLSIPVVASAQAPVPFVGMGDSIGEGVQSGDASYATQGHSYINLIAWRMGQDLSLPLIRSGPFSAVGGTISRSRVSLTTRSRNLAVSGADVTSILTDAATALTVDEIDSETELVLFPHTGSQIEIAERLRPAVVSCWIGNNDALGAATAFDELNATQLTPIPEFTARFTELVERLDAMGTKAVFGTIPDITGIGFLLGRQELIRFLGSDHGLPEGHLTSVVAMFLVRLGLQSPSIFSNPDFVLDPAEQAIISNHVAALNNVIRTTVAAHGMALADINAMFNVLSAAPFDVFGTTMTTRFLGGMFSLDAVHPSNTGHALAAFVFIAALNQHYGLGIPQIDAGTLYWMLQTDPHVDRDGDGRVAGRSSAGLLETLMWLMDIAGDTEGAGIAAPRSGATTVAPSANVALDEYARATGHDLRKMSRAEQRHALKGLFGLRR